MSVRSLFASQDEATLLTVDNEKYFVIDGKGRSITPPADFKNFGVESDENAERVYFKCPRIVGDNIDLTALNLRVNYQNAKGEKDKYLVTDVIADGEFVYFSWLLSRKCTIYSGIISFIVCAIKTDSSGVVKNEWNTTLCTGVVLGGLEVENPEIPEDTNDLVNQLVDIINNSISEAESKSAEAIENVKAAEEAAIDNIGKTLDDTLKVKGKAADAMAVGDELNTKADIILRSASGEAIVVDDSANIRLQGLKVFGKSEQLGTPTPESPVDIVSVENPKVNVCGKNLFNSSLLLNASGWAENKGVYSGNAARLYDVFNDSNGMPLVTGFKKGVQYTLSLKGYSVDVEEKTSVVFLFLYDDGTKQNLYIKTIDEAEHILVSIAGKNVVALHANFGNSIGACLRNMQLEEGAVATEYESYNGGDITLPYALHGIPVESGGNYTDASGQQWICDEIDLEHGIYIQRVKKYNLYSYIDKYCTQTDNSRYSDNILRFDFGYILGCKVKSIVLCNRFEFGFAHNADSTNRMRERISSHNTTDMVSVFIDKNRLVIADIAGFKAYLESNQTIIYIELATPIEISLSEAEIAAFKALYSNYPTTTLLNNQGAYMEVKYAADIENYISARFKVLEERIKALERGV